MYSRDEKRALVQEFWDSFDVYCAAQNRQHGVRVKWMLDQTGIKDLDLRFEVGRKCSSVILEVTSRNEDKRLLVFELLSQYRLLIEDGFEEPLDWDLIYEKENGHVVSRVWISLCDVDIHKPKHWERMMAFMYTNMCLLQENFCDVKDVLEDKIRHLYDQGLI
ncbi:DUF4268 domain-containing protein [Halosquirtibacter xylanolyticus]|uniref:DUF4268 domain-containing protein n=1 Tax=Halosquirtibacter xylanolyticus TaxID=3374599 RepID=UPI00374A78EE|nr:DUF4268 domain-containing protein [Prolixibacteraceae bacterium]